MIQNAWLKKRYNVFIHIVCQTQEGFYAFMELVSITHVFNSKPKYCIRNTI